MASPHWKPPNTNTNNHNQHNHDNTTATQSNSNSNNNAYNGRSCSSFSSSPNVFSNKSNSNSLNNDSNSGSATQTGFREAGIVEKLLASYGFIQCCERQARLFFHYSQYSGNIEHLKLGDPVEFEMTYDRRTGKPIASTVVKITSEAFMAEELSTERVSGFITTEVSSEREGRVAYENRGECFFLPFTTDDIEDDDKLSSKDRVTFYIGADKSGNLRARHVKLEIPTPQKHEGVICTIKDSFGFIERADVVKEIFFHSSECKDFKDLILGDDVEFCIQIRNNKEVAVNVNKLSPGTVVFEDVSDSVYNGHIIKTIERQNSHSCSRPQSSSNAITGAPTDPFPGRIVYKKNNAETEISFGERDVKGEYTLQMNDFVRFNIVTDRRDQLQHSTNVELVDDAFEISGEHREQGYVAALRDYYGFIKCLNREGTRVYFRLSELLNPNLQLKLNDELEFTVAPDLSSPGRLQAIRIKLLPDGTIFKNLFSPVKNNKLVGNANLLSNGMSICHNSESNMNGNECDIYETTNEFPLIDLNTELDTVRSTALNATETSASNANNVTKNSQGIVAKSNSWSEILSQLDIGTNMSELSNEKTKDLLTSASNFFSDQSLTLEPLKPMILQESPKIENNQINLDSQSVLKTKKEISPKPNGPRASPQTKNGIKYPYRGYVVALKETFGFIEAEDGQRELFFHYSVYDGNVDILELGDQVEYSTSYKNSKLTALAVRKTSTKIADDLVQSEIMTGIVTRTVRTFNPDQSEYTGLIRVVNDNTENPLKTENAQCDSPPIHYEFSMIGLMEMHEFIQKGDVVKFQIGFNPVTETERAVNIKPIRTKHQGTIECIKGSFGFLNCESNEDGKNNLFFHMSELKGNSNNLQPGDVVEFVVLHSQRSGKYSACNIVKIGETQAIRPERLTRVKIEECGPKVVVIRNPKGPDGSKGFNNRAPVVAK